jgi:DNA-binding transcriptional regulator YhcF (GntR family)
MVQVPEEGIEGGAAGASPSIEAAVADPVADLDRADDLPVGVQLAWRLRALIASGRLMPGDRLPGVRELAAGTGVNVNTARAVYRRLEEEGLISSRQGRGTFVAPGTISSPELERLAAVASEAALAEGIEPRELARVLYVGRSAAALESALDRPPVDAGRPAPSDEELLAELGLEEIEEIGAGDEALGRRELRRQIERLEAELAYHPEFASEGKGETHPLLRPKPHVADLAELEAVRDELLERLRVARDRAAREAARERRARARLEEMLSDPAAHKWERVSSEELGEPGCKHYRVWPRWGPVGALMSWWQVKVSGGCPLAAPREAASG